MCVCVEGDVGSFFCFVGFLLLLLLLVFCSFFPEKKSRFMDQDCDGNTRSRSLAASIEYTEKPEIKTAPCLPLFLFSGHVD